MAIAWTAIQDALRTWVISSAGGAFTDVIFERQHGPQPALPYATISLKPVITPYGRNDELRLSTAATWAPATPYGAGARVINGTNLYVCTTGGTSAGSRGPTGTGTAITDGTCTWKYFSAANGAEVLPTVVGQREFVAVLEVFAGNVTGSGTAMELLASAQTALSLPSVQASFTAALFCLADRGQPLDLSSLVETAFQSRALIECRFRTVDAVVDAPTGYIATAVVTPTFS